MSFCRIGQPSFYGEGFKGITEGANDTMLVRMALDASAGVAYSPSADLYRLRAQVSGVDTIRGRGHMKRYVVFGGLNYYPGGGWSDFFKCFDDASEAAMKAGKEFSGKGEWWQVIDLQTGEVVASG